jgi:hypothetical protein
MKIELPLAVIKEEEDNKIDMKKRIATPRLLKLESLT